jgi:tRNA (guanosine-2'-O-)-methyltransferase
MRAVLAERTRYVTVAIEDIFQPHNASAVLRTCDCFGVQDIHIIENRNTYRLNPGVELGTAQWLSLHRYNEASQNTPLAIDHLRASGYRVVATTPHTNQTALPEFSLEAGPVALLFGTEMHGLSETALELADEHVVIPMYGFVESFNISVSAAIILSHLSDRLRASQAAIDYHLTQEEQESLYLDWLRASITRVELVERRFEQGDTADG